MILLFRKFRSYRKTDNKMGVLDFGKTSNNTEAQRKEFAAPLFQKMMQLTCQLVNLFTRQLLSFRI